MNNNFKKPHTREKGAALLIFVLLFLVASTLLVYGISNGAYRDILQFRTLSISKQVFFVGEAAIEDAIYRHRSNLNYSSSESFTIATTSVNVSRSVVGDTFQFDIDADGYDITRKGYLEFTIGDGASFGYGLQSDTGGILMENSSEVLGNIYANGSVVGVGGGKNGSKVSGTVISAGASGYVEGVYSTSSIYAHDMVDVWVEEDAYCDSIDDSTVSGFLFCNSVTATSPNPADGPGPSDQPVTVLPLSDDDIEGQKAEASAGEIITAASPRCSSGTFIIDGSTTTGPAKIECDVEVRTSGTTWTLTGQIWIEGDLTIGVGEPEIAIDSSLDGKAVVIVADNESDRVTSSKIDMSNKATFTGYGTDSYIILISQNNDEEGAGAGAGGEIAIDSGQSSVGEVLLYAPHGEIVIGQSGTFVGVAAELIRLKNSAKVVYESGAISLEFPCGGTCAGGYIVNTWEEVQ